MTCLNNDGYEMRDSGCEITPLLQVVYPVSRIPHPVSCISGLAALLEQGIKPGVDAAGIAFKDLVKVLLAQALQLVDVAFGIVVMVAGLRIDALHRADHFRGEQDVVDR